MNSSVSRFRRLVRIVMTVALCMIFSPAGAGQRAHTHGLLQLDVAIDPQSVTVQFESPLDNFLGFEHAPRTDEERKRVAAMVASLKAADGLFYIDPVAECRLSRVALHSAVLGLDNDGEDKQRQHDAGKGKKAQAEEGSEHADIDVTIVFSCRNADKAGFIAFKLFDKYSHLHTVDVQIASAQGQFKRTLRADSPKLNLER